MIHHDSLHARAEGREEGEGREGGKERDRRVDKEERKREKPQLCVCNFFIIQSHILFVRIESLGPAHRITHRHGTSQARKLPTSVVNTIFL